ncbi:MAG: hypothetical protein ACXWV9_03470 [Flavisolibacter sp.]
MDGGSGFSGFRLLGFTWMMDQVFHDFRQMVSLGWWMVILVFFRISDKLVLLDDGHGLARMLDLFGLF